MSESQKGKKMPVDSKVFSSEFRKQARQRMLGKKQSPETIAKRIATRKGYKHSDETRIKISKSNAGKGWKGDNAGYSALHKWVYKILGKATICEYCLTSVNVEWANKSHEYRRDISDWIALCRKCHVAYDKGRSDIKLRFGLGN